MKTVLCVDDDPIAQKLYALLLKNAGFDFAGTTTVTGALEMIELQPYLALILDYMMPDAGGLDLAGRIRRHRDESIRKLPLIVCSASLDRRAVQQFSALGVRHFLVKPIDREILKQTLTRVSGSQWNGSAIRSLEIICHNLGVGCGEVIDLLKEASDQIYELYELLRQNCLSHDDGAIKSQCARMRSALGNLGLRSDDDWMMEVRGLITAVEAGHDDAASTWETQFSKLGQCLDRLKQDLEKLAAPPAPQPPDKVEADPPPETVSETKVAV